MLIFNCRRTADSTVHLLWFFSGSAVGTILYLKTAEWLRSTSIPNGHVCSRVPAPQQHMLQACSPLAERFILRPQHRQRGEPWSLAVGSGFLQGSEHISNRPGNGARPLFFPNYPFPLSVVQQLNLWGIVWGAQRLLHSMSRAHALIWSIAANKQGSSDSNAGWIPFQGLFC